MRFIFLNLALLGIALALPQSALIQDARIRYDNFSVFQIKVKNLQQRELLEKWALEYEEDVKLWHDNGTELHFMISPSVLPHFKNFTMQYKGLAVKRMIKNVQSVIDEESKQTLKAAATAVGFGWTRYYPLADIYAWIDDILARYPNVTEGFVLGKSYEGRYIRGIKISYKKGNAGIFIESNIHAREWITSATATCFINELLSSQNAQVRQLAEQNDWYIVPVLNVDGFTYSHERDRLWRKTRQPSATSKCIGADPNRNFDTHWRENSGSSSNPCSENYAGSHAFSEPEPKALADFVTANKQKLNILLAFHCHGQYVLSPYGHNTTEFPPNHADLLSISKAYADAVENLSYKTKYTYGASADTLYVTSGATPDWCYNKADIKITYTIEMRDKGRFGYVLPPVQILPNCEETLTGILALVKQANSLGYLKPKY